MDYDNISAQMRKGVLAYCILSIVAKEDAYSSDIIEDMKKAQLIVVEGTVYPLLSRLKNDGFLEYRWEESRSGPPRKYYKITDKGKKYLSGLDEVWSAITESVQIITQKNMNNE